VDDGSHTKGDFLYDDTFFGNFHKKKKVLLMKINFCMWTIIHTQKIKSKKKKLKIKNKNK
jgi:hypothetical protein